MNPCFRFYSILFLLCSSLNSWADATQPNAAPPPAQQSPAQSSAMVTDEHNNLSTLLNLAIDPQLSAGELAYQQGLLEKALNEWRAELAKQPDSQLQIELLRRMARGYQALGMHRQVFNSLGQAQELLVHLPENSAQTLILTTLINSDLSDAWLTTGDIDESIAVIEPVLKQIDDFQKVGETASNEILSLTQKAALLAYANNVYANALASTGNDDEQAISVYQQAAKNAQSANLLNLYLTLNLNQLNVMAENAVPTLFLQQSELVWQALSTQKTGYDTAIQWLNFIEIIQRQLISLDNLETNSLPSHFKPQLTQYQQQAIHYILQFAQQQPRLASLAYGMLGQRYAHEKHYKEAMTATRQAIFYAQQGYHPDILYQWQWQLGRLFKALGQREEAIKAYQQATQTLQPIQQTLEVGVRRPLETFNEKIRPVFYELVDLQLQLLEGVQNAKRRQQILHQARDTAEKVKLAELQNYFQDDCVAGLSQKSQRLESIAETTAILYPITLAERLVLLLSIKEEIQIFTLPVTADNFNQTAQDLRVGLQTRPNNRYLLPAQQMYDWLIRPLLPALHTAAIDTLVVVPDGSLRLVPLATLHSGSQFLIEQYALAVTPGLTLIDPRPINWQQPNVLLVGLSEAVQGYPPLPNVPTELQTIRHTFQDKPLELLDKNYTEDTFKQQLKSTQYNVVHLATHGEFSSDPEETFLLTYQDHMTMDKLQQLIGLSRFDEQPLGLLTLSACRTAVGDERAALGLAGVAVKAGARSALATLWFVDDEATSLAMQQFYRLLAEKPNLSKAKALQQVQVNLLKQVRFQHPAYWGPFLLIGNWL